jgi:hypothetical protein
MRLPELFSGWRFEASDESSAAPKLDWRHVYQLFSPHNCVVVILALEPAVPTQLAIVINCHNAIMAHLHGCSKKSRQAEYDRLTASLVWVRTLRKLSGG